MGNSIDFAILANGVPAAHCGTCVFKNRVAAPSAITTSTPVTA